MATNNHYRCLIYSLGVPMLIVSTRERFSPLFVNTRWSNVLKSLASLHTCPTLMPEANAL